MFKVTLTISGNDLSSLPFAKAKNVKIEPVAEVRPLRQILQQPVIYRKAEHGAKVIDVIATLAHHNVTLAELRSRKWPRSSWQYSVKKAAGHQSL